MGWKAFVVFAAEESGYFATMPTHDPARADKIREQLGLSGFERKGPVVLESVMNPKRGQLIIGAYPRGLVICHRDAPGCFFDDRSHRKISGSAGGFAQFKDNLLALYPKGEVIAIVLHSVVNLWGYSVYNNGCLLRSAAGASDDGIIVAEGAPLPEESRILSSCPIENVEEEGVGEELVFDVSARMFGKRIDEIQNLELSMTEYTRHGLFRSLIERLQSR